MTNTVSLMLCLCNTMHLRVQSKKIIEKEIKRDICLPWRPLLFQLLIFPMSGNNTFTEFHWQLETTNSRFWLVNILLWKFDPLSEKEMKVLSNIFSWTCCPTELWCNMLQCSKLYRDRENLLTAFCQTNTLLLKNQILQNHVSFFWSSRVLCPLPHTSLWRKVLQKKETNNFEFSFQRVCLFPPFDWRKITEEIAERKSFLDI